ncbi:FAD binding domain-containing protein [Streptomonospora wellingtoniae]|uniref:Xanthine dehydrogenase family protein subunit M n=1 Tax=Streptomonospora wellingtoniae TaxID=3075544 RepID=A0ABU2KYP1_9ACTN|nr:xanthine dehydrogenase family protein subunit M [Streptomonospora sp. DSM 45055]MDT0304420.1 xanthine dehydrogenase family protein subunit M [Streptomonospora sp. DSM 45055]
MIPAQFDYVRPDDVAEAVRVLADCEEPKVMAGGQSLTPLLRFRLAYPDVVVDLSGLTELRGVTDDGDRLRVGAMTTHDEVMRDPMVAQHCDLLAQATRTVADPAVRHRGTLGGSLAHADPAGDLPAVALALDAEFMVSGEDGERTVQASEFFQDYLTTVLDVGDVLTAVRFPKMGGWSCHYEKFSQAAQAWAIVGVAAAVRLDGGTVAEARIGLTNMGSTPVRARGVEEACRGVPARADALREAAQSADAGTDPPNDLNARADYRRHLARVLTGRALARAAGV